MQVVELSDHPSPMLQETERRRGAAQRQARTQFETAHAQQLERIGRAVAARDQARAQRRWWTWWRVALTLWRERRRVPPQSRLRDLIERDHRHHQARGPSRGPRARPVTRRNVR